MRDDGTAAGAFVHPTGRLADGVTVDPGPIIGADAEIGEGQEDGPAVADRGSRAALAGALHRIGPFGETQVASGLPKTPVSLFTARPAQNKGPRYGFSRTRTIVAPSPH
jgi:hypothetical protein